MSNITLSSVRPIGEVISSILNWVCPECGGKMGGKGLEFKCQGRCQTDWSELWNLAPRVPSSGLDYLPNWDRNDR
jgi:tRNA(Ile2) C34 agmatinyltransferase TiaS